MKRWLFVLCFVVTNAWAIDVRVTADNAPLFGKPGDGRPIGRVAKGKVLKTVGNEVGGYYRLAARNGREVYIAKRSVTVAGGVEEELVETKATDDNGSDWPRFTYDLGGAFGSSGGQSYFELGLGLNTFFREWISWRNAGFYRRASEFSAVGLDTSVRGHLSFEAGEVVGLFPSVGIGYRIANQNLSAPFVEGGLGVKLGPIYLGGGVKYLCYKLVRDNAENQLVFSLTLAGGGSL